MVTGSEMTKEQLHKAIAGCCISEESAQEAVNRAMELIEAKDKFCQCTDDRSSFYLDKEGNAICYDCDLPIK